MIRVSRRPSRRETCVTGGTVAFPQENKGMDPKLTRDTLKKLIEIEHCRCVSLYLTTAEAGIETLRGATRLKQLLKQAREQLISSGLKGHSAAAFLQPASDLLDEYPFWQMQRRGLALFITSRFFRGFQLPYPVRDGAIVSTCFHLKPLLPFVSDDQQFLLLAVSLNRVRMFRGGRYEFDELEIEGLPGSAEEALRFDDPKKSLQTHAGAPIGSQGLPSGIVHGHGAAREHSDQYTRRFFERLGTGLQDFLKQEDAPLVLASVDHYLPLLREVTRYPHVVDDVLSGNQDETPPDELHRKGWELVKPRMESRHNRLREVVEAGLANNRATSDVEEAVAAALHGRAQTCFVTMDHKIWGAVDDTTAEVRYLAPADLHARDLLDLTATKTFLHGGDIVPVPTTASVPGGTAVAVQMRY